MTRLSRLSLVTVAIAGGMTCLPYTGAYAAQASNMAMSDIKAARTALNNGNTGAAVERLERAETGLLNAKQAGETVDQKTLDDVKSAHDALVDKKDKAAAKAALDKAAGDLRT